MNKKNKWCQGQQNPFGGRGNKEDKEQQYTFNPDNVGYIIIVFVQTNVPLLVTGFKINRKLKKIRTI